MIIFANLLVALAQMLDYVLWAYALDFISAGGDFLDQCRLP